mmetsp:Transcript_33680/g.39599  ORF Transcript_33680/g.39599 Transcript_33680/m.39599 type:complete len:87 (-) Transcript_33680:643-903(-)
MEGFINGGTTLDGLTLLTACLKLVRVGSDEVEHGFTMNLGSTITDRETVKAELDAITNSNFGKLEIFLAGWRQVHFDQFGNYETIP